MYKALFIDVDDTLISFGACSRKALQNTFHSFNLEYNDAVYNIYARIDDCLWAQQKQGILSVQEVLASRFKEFSMQMNMSVDDVQFQLVFAQKLSEECLLEPNVTDTIDYLRLKYRLFAASNGLLSVQLERLEKAGLLSYFTDVFVSDNIGYDKPDALFFESCKAKSSLDSRDILFIGDSLEADITGANRCRIDTCWYNPKGLDNYLNEKVNFVISDLSELRKIL